MFYGPTGLLYERRNTDSGIYQGGMLKKARAVVVYHATSGYTVLCFALSWYSRVGV